MATTLNSEVLNKRYNRRMFCQCGCGEITPISKLTDHRWGYVRGEHRRYITGHKARKASRPYVVDANDCWLWQLCILAGGYGRLWDRGKVRVAHRVYWEAEHGPVPEGLELDHLCRVRHCVNPAHLELVTRGTNIRRGEGCKITLDDARAIKVSGEPLKVLSERYGITMSMVSQIRRGKVWKDA